MGSQNEDTGLTFRARHCQHLMKEGRSPREFEDCPFGQNLIRVGPPRWRTNMAQACRQHRQRHPGRTVRGPRRVATGAQNVENRNVHSGLLLFTFLYMGRGHFVSPQLPCDLL